MPGQADVEHDEVRAPGAVAKSRPSSPRAGDGDLVALLLEGVLDPAGDGVLVFDDQDGGGHARDATPARRPNARRAATRGTVARFRAPRHPAPPASRSPSPEREHDPEVPAHVHRPRDAGRRAPRADRQEGRPPPPRRPPARPSSTATASTRDNVSRRRPRVRAAPPPHRAERPGRPVGRRQEGASRSSSTASRSTRSTAGRSTSTCSSSA